MKKIRKKPERNMKRDTANKIKRSTRNTSIYQELSYS